jgi:hypothetical protein
MSTGQWRYNKAMLRAAPARLTLLSFTLILGCGLYLVLNSIDPRQRNPDDSDLKVREGDWRSHPALTVPDGRSHRHGKILVGDNVNDPRVLAELSRRFRATKELAFIKVGNDWKLRGEQDFEIRQEYFLRLLDHYWFSKDRLTGMTRQQIESLFGPGGLDPGRRSGRLQWSAGRDMLLADIENNRVLGAQYVMGY